MRRTIGSQPQPQPRAWGPRQAPLGKDKGFGVYRGQEGVLTYKGTPARRGWGPGGTHKLEFPKSLTPLPNAPVGGHKGFNPNWADAAAAAVPFALYDGPRHASQAPGMGGGFQPTPRGFPAPPMMPPPPIPQDRLGAGIVDGGGVPRERMSQMSPETLAQIMALLSAFQPRG